LRSCSRSSLFLLASRVSFPLDELPSSYLRFLTTPPLACPRTLFCSHFFGENTPSRSRAILPPPCTTHPQAHEARTFETNIAQVSMVEAPCQRKLGKGLVSGLNLGRGHIQRVEERCFRRRSAADAEQTTGGSRRHTVGPLQGLMVRIAPGGVGEQGWGPACFSRFTRFIQCFTPKACFLRNCNKKSQAQAVHMDLCHTSSKNSGNGLDISRAAAPLLANESALRMRRRLGHRTFARNLHPCPRRTKPV